jgi:FHA domain
MLHFQTSLKAIDPVSRLLEQYPHLKVGLPQGMPPALMAQFFAPVFTAPRRSRLPYIQAIVQGEQTFLTANLSDYRSTHATTWGQSWLVGRGSHCAIPLGLATISRFHAVVGRCSDRGFYVLDLGSRNGTFVNGRRIEAFRKRGLQEGDRLCFSHVELMFWVAHLEDVNPWFETTQPLLAA